MVEYRYDTGIDMQPLNQHSLFGKRRRRFVHALLGLVLILAYGTPAVAESNLEQLRAARDADLQRIRRVYDQRALRRVPKNPDGTLNYDSPQYQRLEADYRQAVESTRYKYAKQDPRGSMIDDVLSRHPDIMNTGSKPADVYADVDLAGRSPDATSRVASEWKAQGHKVEAIRTPDGEVVKYVNHTTDTTMWNPETEGIKKWKVGDHDAWTTAGGQKGTGNIDRPSDPRGYVIDNEGKFVHSDTDTRFSGHDENLKTFAKSVDKAGAHMGLDKSNPEFYEQARRLRKYNDPVEAGIAKLGDSPDVQARKVEEWKQRGRQEMQKAKVEAEAKGRRIDEIRGQLRDQVRSTLDKTPDELQGMNRDMDQRIQDRIDDAATSRAAQDAENRRMAEDMNKGKTGDAESQRTRATDAPEGKPPRAGDPDTPSKVAAEGSGAKTTKVAADAPDGRPVTVEADAPGRKPVRVGDVDTPSKVAGDAPLGKPKAPAGDVPVSTRAKVVDGVGKVMVASDILNVGQDIVDYTEGKKSGGEVLKNTADTLSGGAISAAEMTHQKASDYSDAKAATEAANQREREAHSQQVYINARNAGASRDEAQQLMDAARNQQWDSVNQMRRDLADKGVEFEIPRGPVDQTFGVFDGDDNALERTGEVLTGMKDQAVRAGTFVKDTGVRLGGMAKSAATEEGVYQEVVDQTFDNIVGLEDAPADIMAIRAANQNVEEQQRQQRAQAGVLRDQLIDRGATPEEADAAIASFLDKDSAGTSIRDLRTRLDGDNAATQARIDGMLNEYSATSEEADILNKIAIDLEHGTPEQRAAARETLRDIETLRGQGDHRWATGPDPFADERKQDEISRIDRLIGDAEPGSEEWERLQDIKQGLNSSDRDRSLSAWADLNDAERQREWAKQEEAERRANTAAEMDKAMDDLEALTGLQRLLGDDEGKEVASIPRDQVYDPAQSIRDQKVDGLQNDNWNMQNLQGDIDDKIHDLEDQIANSRNSTERRELERQLAEQQAERQRIQDRINANNQELTDMGANTGTGYGENTSTEGLQDHNWNLGNMRDKADDKIADLEGQIANSRNSAERARLQQELRDQQRERDSIQQQIDQNNQALVNRGAAPGDGSPDSYADSPWTRDQLENDIWNMGNLAEKEKEKIDDLQEQINNSRNSTERRRLQAELDAARAEHQALNDRIEEDQRYLEGIDNAEAAASALFESGDFEELSDEEFERLLDESLGEPEMIENDPFDDGDWGEVDPEDFEDEEWGVDYDMDGDGIADDLGLAGALNDERRIRSAADGAEDRADGITDAAGSDISGWKGAATEDDPFGDNLTKGVQDGVANAAGNIGGSAADGATSGGGSSGGDGSSVTAPATTQPATTTSTSTKKKKKKKKKKSGGSRRGGRGGGGGGGGCAQVPIPLPIYAHAA